MRSSNVLVFGGGFQALGLIKALRAVAGIRVLVADVNEENVARYFADAFFRMPSLKEKQVFEDFIVNLCEREGVSAFLHPPNRKWSYWRITRNVFEARGAIVYVSDIPLLELARDKLLFYRWLLNEGLPCLPCYTTPLDQVRLFP